MVVAFVHSEALQGWFDYELTSSKDPSPQIWSPRELNLHRWMAESQCSKAAYGSCSKVPTRPAPMGWNALGKLHGADAWLP